MKEIDAQFLEHPYYGVERMTDYLNLRLGYHVNVKRIRRLYKIMGLQTNITYIPMFRGFMYMNAFIDVHSRKILNWNISNSMKKEWCIELLEDTIGAIRSLSDT